MLARSEIPASGSYWLRHARLPDRAELVDLQVADGSVAAIAPAGTAAVGPDLGGCQIWPGFVDIHTHLDKGYIWSRAPNRDGTFASAMATVAADRTNWTEADLRRRMEFALGAAHAHGTVALRTHLDSGHPGVMTAWRLFASLRDEWSGRITLQAASLASLEVYEGDQGTILADTVAKAGGVLGGVTKLGGALGDPIPEDFPARLDHLLALAQDRGLDLDLHVDESGEPGARALGLITHAVSRRGLRGRVVCGHCCSLSLQPEDLVHDTIAAVADAGIAVVSLPMCNMYLQDRVPGRTPRWRGVTLVHELRAAGVPVAIASDNCGDPFYPYGDLDMLEVFREGTRILHLDHSPDWSGAVNALPAGLMGLAAGRIEPGVAADLVLFGARDARELLARPQMDRIVLRRGRVLDAVPPDPAGLDDI